MKKSLFKFVLLTVSLLIFGFISAACANQATQPAATAPEENQLEMANPASVYCQEQGYQWELRTGEDGGQLGMCIFPDGSECDEWAYYRGECAPGEQADTTSSEAISPEAILSEGNSDSLDAISGKPVVAWTGHVSSAPEDSQFDDYLVLMPEGSGEIGLAGLNPEMEAEIVSLRDGSGVEEFAIFWGELFCEVPDFGGCQLVVEKILKGSAQSEPEPLEDWTGMVVCSHFNSSPDNECGNAFVLLGDFPVWYGIWSQDADILTQINALRETGQIIVVSGQLLAGVPDVNGTQIQVEKIDIYDR